MFYLLLKDRRDRDNFIAAMNEAGITTPFHYVPLHSAPAGQKYGRVAGSMTVTDQVSDSLVRLPLYFKMTNADQDAVIRSILKLLG